MNNKENSEKSGKKSEDLENALNSLLKSEEIEDMDCSSGVCIIKGDKSIVERINKKIITEDGRQLLI